MVIQKYSSELVKLHIWKENVLIDVKIAVYVFKKLGEDTYAKRNTFKFEKVHC